MYANFADEDGYITVLQVRKIVDALGKKISPQELQTMFAEIDEDQSGVVDFREFLGLMQRLS